MKKVVKHTGKCLKWLGIGLVAFAALLTAYFYIGGIEWGDWTIPDEAELRLEKVEVPDEDNAYLALIALTNLYHVAEGDENTKEISDEMFVRCYGNPSSTDGDDDMRKMRDAVRRDPASPVRVARILSDNKELFAALPAALSLGGFKLPGAFDPRRDPFIVSLPNLKSLFGFACLVNMKAQVDLENGNAKAAAAGVEEVHRMGKMLAEKIGPDPGAFVQYLVGEMLMRLAYRKMCDIVAAGNAPAEVLEEFAKIADEDFAAASANRARALKAEWEKHFLFADWFCDTVHNSATYDECLRALYEGVDEEYRYRWYYSGMSPLRALWHWPGMRKFALHRREMKFMYARDLRMMLAEDYSENAHAAMLERETRYGIFTLLLPNGLFRVMHASWLPSLSPYFARPVLECSHVRLVIASEKWRRAHDGENPPTLEALVPDYLAAVPADPWDKAGGPIKYDAASGVVWSVGNDGKYDYRKVAKDRTAGCESSLDKDTRIYAFRIDGKPVDCAAPVRHCP